MPPELRRLLVDQHGVATFAQIQQSISRRTMQRLLRSGQLVKIWPNIYSWAAPNPQTRLRGLDLRCGTPIAVCLGTAADMFGFDTQDVSDLHVLNPVGHLLRDESGLVVHRRDGTPLTTYFGRPITTPARTAIEVARALPRPRALATLDAALRSGTCSLPDLQLAAGRQAGRRGIVTVRNLIPLARPQAESPMESEARLVFIDAGLPQPVLQHEIVDRDGRIWRVDFAWPELMVVVEYDGFDWHSSPKDLRRDRQKRAALEEMGWRILAIVSDDIRRQPVPTIRRLWGLLDGRRAA